MGDFAGGVRRRVQQAREALSAAQESGDEYAVRMHSADLDEMMRVARGHGIIIDEPDPDEG